MKVTINMDTDSGVRHLAPLHHLEELILDCCSALGPGLDTLLAAGGGYSIDISRWRPTFPKFSLQRTHLGPLLNRHMFFEGRYNMML